jgi:hypothetical protein
MQPPQTTMVQSPTHALASASTASAGDNITIEPQPKHNDK